MEKLGLRLHIKHDSMIIIFTYLSIHRSKYIKKKNHGNDLRECFTGTFLFPFY